MKFESGCIEDRTDHKGNVYKSVSMMCIAYGINKDTYLKRINRSGWTKEKALETPIKECSTVTTTKIDHIGNAFATVNDMCDYWGISYRTYAERIKRGCGIEEALSGGKVGKLGNIDGSYKPVHRKRSTSIEDRTDHKGIVYGSKREMCETYGIRQDVYRIRTKRDGWSKERALETPIQKHESVSETRIDHTGKEHSSVKEMCRYWNVSYPVYIQRLKDGYSLEEALTLRLRTRMEPVDHLGRRFKSVAEMRMHWGIDKSLFYNRLRRGWSLERTLTEKIDDKYSVTQN